MSIHAIKNQNEFHAIYIYIYIYIYILKQKYQTHVIKNQNTKLMQ